ncbi:hypothetical protein GGP41_010514 [Bipolaris sorokiniana]|uniref:Uncharacterized protein n=1 Tax=Cochliobolus sativus TaxID=45130 RepID=A0A8H5ZKJ0_COCSA|nr:hypothetical protein GGP41_010514 [Bipolaris sorokiniana]
MGWLPDTLAPKPDAEDHVGATLEIVPCWAKPYRIGAKSTCPRCMVANQGSRYCGNTPKHPGPGEKKQVLSPVSGMAQTGVDVELPPDTWERDWGKRRLGARIQKTRYGRGMCRARRKPLYASLSSKPKGQKQSRQLKPISQMEPTDAMESPSADKDMFALCSLAS